MCLDRLASEGIIILYVIIIVPGEAVVAILLVCTVTEDGRVGVWVYFGVAVTTTFIFEGALPVVVLGGNGVIALVLLIWKTVVACCSGSVLEWLGRIINSVITELPNTLTTPPICVNF